MTEFQKILIETIKQFHKICSDNGLTYYAFGGTALGAYRHKGFIPWDDDLDVVMRRDDYDKLVELSRAPNNNWREYKLSYFGDGKISQPFAKFYSTAYTIWEYKKFPVIVGPWVDVFPLDLDDSKHPHDDLFDTVSFIRWKYIKTIQYCSWREILYDFSHFRGLNGPIKLVKKIIMPFFRKYYLYRISQLRERVRSIKTGDVFARYGGSRRRFETRYFSEKPTEMPFEDTVINMPCFCDEYLAFYFGQDFMKLPPLEERVGHHDVYYMDLQKAKTLEEVLDEIGDDFGTDPVITLKGIVNGIKNRKKY